MSSENDSFKEMSLECVPHNNSFLRTERQNMFCVCRVMLLRDNFDQSCGMLIRITLFRDSNNCHKHIDRSVEQEQAKLSFKSYHQ